MPITAETGREKAGAFSLGSGRIARFRMNPTVGWGEPREPQRRNPPGLIGVHCIHPDLPGSGFRVKPTVGWGEPREPQRRNPPGPVGVHSIHPDLPGSGFRVKPTVGWGEPREPQRRNPPGPVGVHSIHPNLRDSRPVVFRITDCRPAGGRVRRAAWRRSGPFVVLKTRRISYATVGS